MKATARERMHLALAVDGARERLGWWKFLMPKKRLEKVVLGALYGVSFFTTMAHLVTLSDEQEAGKDTSHDD